jgi:hypothetical protein
MDFVGVPLSRQPLAATQENKPLFINLFRLFSRLRFGNMNAPQIYYEITVICWIMLALLK